METPRERPGKCGENGSLFDAPRLLKAGLPMRAKESPPAERKRLSAEGDRLAIGAEPRRSLPFCAPRDNEAIPQEQ
jgi:hypothetical protein